MARNRATLTLTKGELEDIHSSLMDRADSYKKGGEMAGYLPADMLKRARRRHKLFAKRIETILEALEALETATDATGRD